MATLSLQHWQKTVEAQTLIEKQTPFCIGGVVYQGYKKGIIECDEDQMNDNELARVEDVDGTMERIWKNRSDRLQARVDRKKREYDERRNVLRKERSSIRESMKEDKALGLSVNPADIKQIEEIDARMLRLATISDEESAKLAATMTKGVEATTVIIECPECGEKPPLDHTNPQKWLTGHAMHHKRKAG